MAVAGVLPVALLIYATFLPPEARLVLAGQNLYAPRIVGFLLIPFLLRQLVAHPPQWRFFDALFFISLTWILISFSAAYGVFDGILRGGALVLDIFLPYVIARAFVQDLNDLRRLLILIAPGAILVGFSLLAESLSGQFLVRPLFADFFGPIASYEGGDASGTFALRVDYRLGLLRAYGPFPHPIHAGLFMASMLPLYASSGLRGWPVVVGVTAALFAAFSGSSAAYLSFFIAFVLLAYDRIQERVEAATWPIFILGSSVVLLAAELLSKNGVIAIIARATINPQSASYRRLIWEYGTQSVANHPWLGIAFADYQRLPWMGASVDHYWLLLAIRHGVLVPTALLLMALIILVSLSRQIPSLGLADRRFATGLIIAIFLMIVLGATVAFAGSVLCLFFLLLGACGSVVLKPKN